MVATLPPELDVARLTESGAALHGALELARMGRLAAMASPAGDARAHVELHFRRDERGRRLLDGHLRARLTGQCQRCLGPVELGLDHRFMIEFVWGLSQLPQVERGHSPYVLDRDQMVGLAELVEDELILAMPVVARHARNTPCRPPAHRADQIAGGDEAPVREGPFAHLKTLKS